MWCSTSKGGGTLKIKSILGFAFDVLELLLSFKITPHLSKFDQGF